MMVGKNQTRNGYRDLRVGDVQLKNVKYRHSKDAALPRLYSLLAIFLNFSIL
jgi:hypothetical protein